MKLLVLCPQSEGKWFSAGICRITLVLAGHNLTEPAIEFLDDYVGRFGGSIKAIMREQLLFLLRLS